VYNIRFIYLFLVFVMVLSLVPEVSAGGRPDQGKRLVSLLQKRYENTTDISSRFTQETFSPGVSEAVKAEGTVYFKRPHMMRWEYSLPEPQLIVTSGREVYVYEKEARQVMVYPGDRLLSSDISKAFFFGKGDLKRLFTVEYPVTGRSGDKWMLKLTPKKSSSQIRTIWIKLDPKTCLIREMWLENQLSGKTHLVFSDIKVNKGLSDALFRFVSPQGVKVYRADHL